MKILVSGAGAACSRPFAWTRSTLYCLVPEPELAAGPRTSGAGAAQKSGSSATLQLTLKNSVICCDLPSPPVP